MGARLNHGVPLKGKTSPLDALYEGLPVVIVNDWSEVTQENMDKWLFEYGDAFTNPQ